MCYTIYKNISRGCCGADLRGHGLKADDPSGEVIHMKHLISFASAVLFASLSFFTCGAESAETAPVTPSASVQDVRALRDFLLAESDGSDLADKSYDLNGDGRWNAVDLCLMKRALLAGQTPEQQPDTLVAYFSRTGNTEKIANYLIDLTGADRLVIEAAEPYSDADIRYQDDSCRANREQNDKSVRPVIAALPESLDGYDVIILGYPIWWGEEPRIIDTFLEHYDFSEKTVIPFCTSGSSGIGTSEKNIAALVPIGHQLSGRRFAASADKNAVMQWTESLEIPKKEEAVSMKLEINGKTLTAKLSDSTAAGELAEKLKAEPVTVTLNEYGGFEKVGKLPWALTAEDTQIAAQPGDILLYQGNQITVMYGENAWRYTRLATVTGVTAAELAAFLGEGNPQVTLML